MKVRFDQSGGFAGLMRSCEIDTTDMSPDEANKFADLVSSIPESGVFLSDSSRDLHQYEITIVDGESKTSVVFDDQSVPQSVKPLIGYLKKCSKPSKPGE